MSIKYKWFCPICSGEEFITICNDWDKQNEDSYFCPCPCCCDGYITLYDKNNKGDKNV